MKNNKIHPGNIVMSIVALAIVVVGLIYFFNYFSRQNSYEETNDAQVEANVNPISARVGGYIEQVNFEEHQSVKKGDTLVVIDSREFNEQLQIAEAALQDAHAQMAVLESTVKSSEVSKTVNKSKILSADARYWKSQQDMKRYQKLLEEQAVTGADYEQIKAQHDVAMNDLATEKNNLQTNEAGIEALKTKREVLLADIKRKEAEVNLAKLNRSYTAVLAPYDGVVGRKSVMVGQQIQPGQTIVQIIDEKEKWITGNFKETQVAKMHIGQKVKIKFDALGDKEFDGTIDAIAGSTGSKMALMQQDNSTGNFVKIIQRIPVKIRFDSKNLDAIKAGMNAMIDVVK